MSKSSLAAKERGNQHFRKGEHEQAIVAYTAALTALPQTDADESAEQSAVRAACLANRAAARLQLASDRGADPAGAPELTRAARDDCSASLALLERTEGAGGRLAPLARKSLFRRALAHERLGCADESVVDLARLVVDSAGAGEHPPAEAMGVLHGLLTAERLPADGPLAAGVEALLAVLARGLVEDGAEEGDGTGATPRTEPPRVVLQAPQAGAVAALEAGGNLVRAEHKWQAYTALLVVLTARPGARAPPMRAFITCGGARLAHLHLHSMEGDWMADAKRGTIRAIDALVRLPTVAAAMGALELSPHGLHAPPSDGLHGAGCKH